jgi:hypothetical protein
LNHFTVPVAMCSSPLSAMPRRDLAAPTASLPVLAPEPDPCPGHGLPQYQLAIMTFCTMLPGQPGPQR